MLQEPERRSVVPEINSAFSDGKIRQDTEKDGHSGRIATTSIKLYILGRIEDFEWSDWLLTLAAQAPVVELANIQKFL